MILHTFPENKYVVFTYRGQAKNIPTTYGEIWRVFDRNGYRIKAVNFFITFFLYM
ncbi:GyrI-like domain-containing protein [Fictibacillus halophilus]|uniref:GyrI-like domain-containing protein n=1 Tax=Fictibacillus halophilus TaxID=1610490 RepID=UPI0018E7750D